MMNMSVLKPIVIGMMLGLALQGGMIVAMAAGVADLPDLVIENAAMTSDTRDRAIIAFNMANRGTAAAIFSVAGQKVNELQLLDAAGTVLQTSRQEVVAIMTTINLKAGNMIEYSVLMSNYFPQIPAAAVSVRLIADPKNAIKESNDQNNSVVIPLLRPTPISVVVPSTRSDLVIEKVTITRDQSGKAIAKFTMANRGSESAVFSVANNVYGKKTVQLELLDASHNILASSVPSVLSHGRNVTLTPGQTKGHSSYLSSWFPQISANTAYVRFVADPQNVVQESNENNNAITVVFQP